MNSTAIIAVALIIFVIYVEYKLRVIFEILDELNGLFKEHARTMEIHNARLDALEEKWVTKSKSGE